jgi:hypothetical protein
MGRELRRDTGVEAARAILPFLDEDRKMRPR